jgi:hypothetical protein
METPRRSGGGIEIYCDILAASVRATEQQSARPTAMNDYSVAG